MRKIKAKGLNRTKATCQLTLSRAFLFWIWSLIDDAVAYEFQFMFEYMYFSCILFVYNIVTVEAMTLEGLIPCLTLNVKQKFFIKQWQNASFSKWYGVLYSIWKLLYNCKLTFVDENICKFHDMALKHETFIHEIELIYTRAILLQDHSWKASFLLSFIHKSFQLYGIEQA